MKFTFTLLLSLFITPCLFAQVAEPQILFLPPARVVYPPELKKDVDDNTAKLKKQFNLTEMRKAMASADYKNLPANQQAQTKKQFDYLVGMDFFKQLGYISLSSLSYRFEEKFPNMKLRLLDLKCDGNLAALQKISTDEGMQYILNFPLVEIHTDGHQKSSKIAVQLFDGLSGKLLIDKTYIGDERNHGFEFGCEDGTLPCVINNALSQVVDDAEETVFSNSPTIIRERELSQQRANALAQNYYPQAYDKALVTSVLAKDTTVDIASLYQCLYNTGNTKFVAFFLKQVPKTKGGVLSVAKGSGGDRNVKIIGNKKIQDEGYLDQSPQTYVYTVTGILYKSKWYYVKDNVTYFDAPSADEGRLQFFYSLQGFNFFKDNSTDFNPDFWETKLFEKIPDLTKDPQWPKYGKGMWKQEEIENRPYVGQYKIIADKLRGNTDPVVKRINMN